MTGMRMDELNRKICDWLARGGIVAVGVSSMGIDTMGG